MLATTLTPRSSSAWHNLHGWSFLLSCFTLAQLKFMQVLLVIQHKNSQADLKQQLGLYLAPPCAGAYMGCNCGGGGATQVQPRVTTIPVTTKHSRRQQCRLDLLRICLLQWHITSLFQLIISICALAAVAYASDPYAPPVPYHPAPAPYHPAPAPYHPAPAPYHPAPAPYHEETPKNYQFGYDVHGYDEYGNPNVHSRTEARDGYNVKGRLLHDIVKCKPWWKCCYFDYKPWEVDCWVPSNAGHRCKEIVHHNCSRGPLYRRLLLRDWWAKILAQVVVVPTCQRSCGQLATTLVATISDIIFLPLALLARFVNI